MLLFWNVLGLCITISFIVAVVVFLFRAKWTFATIVKNLLDACLIWFGFNPHFDRRVQEKAEADARFKQLAKRDNRKPGQLTDFE